MIPTQLFKFHPDNNYLSDILINKELFCCERKKLNDPYDGLFVLSKDLESKIIEKASNHIKEQFSSDELYRTIPEAFINQFTKKTFCQKKFYDILEQNGGALKICSFTQNFENEIMWAHYAENSKGICFEFDFTSIQNIENTLKQVNYTNATPVANELTLEELHRLFTIKREAWRYEEEWRLLVHNYSYLKFEPINLKRILFGSRISKERKEEIKTICLSNNLEHVVFQDMQITIEGVAFN